MSATVTRPCSRLAASLTELKARARAALATELAAAVGVAVRDALAAALAARLADPPGRAAPRPAGRWDEDDCDRDRDRARWGEPSDPWGDADLPFDRDRTPARAAPDGPEWGGPPAAPAAAIVAAGVSVGRWWLARAGAPGTAVGLAALAAGLGLAGGPVARAALAVLAAADILAAHAALACPDPY